MIENHKLAWNKIKKAKYILIITHINPDPDTLTSALALSFALEQNKIKYKIYNNNKKLPDNLKFLKNYHKIVDKIPDFYDLVISVDCGDKYRFFRQKNDAFDESIPLINIDHHISNNHFGEINIVDPNCASTAELIYDLLDVNNIKITKNCAEALYVGIYTDTLAFTTDRTTNKTFQRIGHIVESGANPDYIATNLVYKDSLAKYKLMPKILQSLELHHEGKTATIELKTEWLKSTGADMEDAESALNLITQIGIVDIVIFLRQGSSKTRVSLRGKNNADVSKIANNFDGGGHLRAAGCVVDTTDINIAKKIILEYIGKLNEL